MSQTADSGSDGAAEAAAEDTGGIRKKFIRNLLSFSGANLIVQGLQFVQGIIIRAILPPSVVGTWNYVGVTQGFTNTFDLGITAGAGRELPLLRGAGKTDEEHLARSTAFWGRLIQALAFAGIIVAVTATGYREAAWNVALTAAALVVLVSCVESYTCFCQSAEKYVFLSRANVIGAVMLLIGVVGGGYYGGATGIMIGAVTATAIKVMVLATGRRDDAMPMLPVLNGPILKRLIGFGLPMRLVDYPLALFTMLDVLLISHFLTAAELGVYTTAKIITMMAVEGPTKLNTVYLSRLYIRCGENKDRAEIAGTLRQFVLAQYTIVLPLSVLGAWWFAKVMIDGMLPRYEEALDSTRLLLLTAFVVPQTSMVRNFWMIDKRFKATGLVNAGGLLAMALSMGVVLFMGDFSLERVAAAYLMGFTIHFLILMATVGREVWGLKQTMSVASVALGAGAYVGGVIFMFAGGRAEPGLIPTLSAAVLPLLASVALVAPLVVCGWHWSGIRNLRP